MSMEISVKLFEKNAKPYNKRGLNRSFSSMSQNAHEYVTPTPLGATSDYVLETVIDKDSVEDFQKYLKRKKFTVLGANNYHFIGKIIEGYNNHKKSFSSLEAQIEAISKDYDLMKKSKKKCEELPNDDVKFYFLPYNDECNTLSQFIDKEKNNILRWCKKNDITIIMNILGYCNMAKGFIGFNFLDDDSKEDVTIDFASNIQISVNMADKMSVYAASVLLSGVGQDEDELTNFSCQIFADNVKIVK